MLDICRVNAHTLGSVLRLSRDTVSLDHNFSPANRVAYVCGPSQYNKSSTKRAGVGKHLNDQEGPINEAPELRN
jgi:hypothetical protein